MAGGLLLLVQGVPAGRPDKGVVQNVQVSVCPLVVLQQERERLVYDAIWSCRLAFWPSALGHFELGQVEGVPRMGLAEVGEFEFHAPHLLCHQCRVLLVKDALEVELEGTLPVLVVKEVVLPLSRSCELFLRSVGSPVSFAVELGVPLLELEPVPGLHSLPGVSTLRSR